MTTITTNGAGPAASLPAPPETPWLRILPLGGCGEIGRNMTLIETRDDLIAVDCGLMFPDDEMFGVDIVINDFSYLRDRIDKFRGVLVTHGHEDHIGGVPYLLREFDVPVWGTPISLALIKAKLRDHRLGDVKFRPVQPGDRVRTGEIETEFIHINHSLAGACSLAIRTPLGIVFHTGDFKFDQTPIEGGPADFAAIARVGDEGVLALLSDSTNAERPGHTPSERIVGDALATIFAKSPGRIIVTSFASNVPRIQQVVDQAIRFDRKIALLGRSLTNVVHFATELGHLHLPQERMIGLHQIDEYPPNQVVVITTGSQGEPMAALSRLAVRDHPKMKIVAGDTVIISATPIPGNEKSVGKTINNLYKLGATVWHGTTATQAHVSGHASQEELLLMLNLVRPRFFIPVHGEYRMLVTHAGLAKRTGVAAADAIVMENGDVLQIVHETAGVPVLASVRGAAVAAVAAATALATGNGSSPHANGRSNPHGRPVTGPRIGSARATKIGRTSGGNVMVDGSGVGDIGESVLRDRKHLSSDGVMMVVVTIDAEEARVVAGPDLVSRGVFYLPESAATMNEIREKLLAVLENCSVEGIRDIGTVKEHIRQSVSKAIFERSRRRPIVVPVVMEV